jgi:pimeloyl-ACP methyl ester carboxylesterase
VVVHGTDGDVIPFAMGQRVAHAIPRTRFEVVKGGHHMDCFEVDGNLLARVTQALSRRP